MKNLFDQYVSTLRVMKTKKIMTCMINLSKNEMLEALKNDYVMINDVKYYTPEHQLKLQLLNDQYGLIELEFEEVES